MARTVADVRRKLKEGKGGEMAEWQDTIERADITPSAVYDAILRYRFVTYYSKNHVGPRDHGLGWSTVPKQGALATLIDAYPIDGRVEIDFYPLGQTGYQVKIRAVWRFHGDRPKNAPKVRPYAQELAAVIRELAGLDKAEETPKKPIYQCNQWLAEQYFEHGNTNLRELVDEWLRIRKEKDIDAQKPTDPLASMRSFIADEKRRRGIV